MRTTLTLDDDVAKRLKDLAHRKGLSFKEAVNAALRRALSTPGGRPRDRAQFRAATFKSAFRPGVDPARLNQLVDDLEARRFAAAK